MQNALGITQKIANFQHIHNLSILFCVKALFPNTEVVEACTHTVILYGNHACLPSNTLHIFSSYKFRISIQKLENLMVTPSNHRMHPPVLPNIVLQR